MGGCAGKQGKVNAIRPTRLNDSTTSTRSKSTDNGSKVIHENSQDQLLPERQLSRKLSLNYTVIPNKNFKGNNQSKGSQGAGLVGLTNLGNTCFLNTALQCLFNIPPLVDYFLNDLHVKEINASNPLGSKGAVTLAFAKLLKEYWSRTDIDEINPKDFYNVVAQFAPQFCQGTQEDCHEFVVFLLDVLHEDLNRVKNKPTFEEKDYTDDRFEEYAKESWRNYLTRNKSVIVDLFQGQSKSTLKCLRCGITSHKFEPYMYLSLPIREENANKISLLDCLKEYSKEEKLEEGERWACPRCKKLVEVTKKLEIWKLPPILIVHLKRFRFNRQSRGKIRTFVDYPIVDLDLSSVCEGFQREKPIYDLIAISNHQGSLGRGHYFSFAKNRDDNSWYAFNDSEVMTVEPQSLSSAAGYLLFFCKTATADFRRQTLSRPDAWPHLTKKSRMSLARVNPEDDRSLHGEDEEERLKEYNSWKSEFPKKSGFQQQRTATNIKVHSINIRPEDREDRAKLISKGNESEVIRSKKNDQVDYNNAAKSTSRGRIDDETDISSGITWRKPRNESGKQENEAQEIRYRRLEGGTSYTQNILKKLQ